MSSLLTNRSDYLDTADRRLVKAVVARLSKLVQGAPSPPPAINGQHRANIENVVRSFVEPAEPEGLAEHFLQLVHEPLGHRMVHVFARRPRELLEQLPLPRSETARRLHHDPHQLIASAVTV
jgi:hypothetical protein